ncbi:hypothetical protein I4U23_004346 [Adineta vaga]|nr:hypothetical protein I4U23_004346 [Adineta vaga]
MKSNNVITYDIAMLITQCLETCKKEDSDIIESKLFNCRVVQKDAQPVLLQLFILPINESIKSSVYYIALLLAKCGCITSTSINCIEDLCRNSIDQKFNHIIRDFLELENINSKLMR